MMNEKRDGLMQTQTDEKITDREIPLSNCEKRLDSLQASGIVDTDGSRPQNKCVREIRDTCKRPDTILARKLLAACEVEAEYGLGKRWLDLARHKGNGPPYMKIGGLVRYPRADLEAWLDSKRVNSTVEA